MHRLSVNSYQGIQSASLLGLQSTDEPTTSCSFVSQSSEYLKHKPRQIQMKRDGHLYDYDEQVVKATAHAVVAASERQSRTALTEIPVCLYHFASDCALSRIPHGRRDVIRDPSSTSRTTPNSRSRARSQLSSHSINVAPTYRIQLSLSPTTIRRKSLLGMPMSFDDAYSSPMTMGTEATNSQLAAVDGYITRQTSGPSTNIRKNDALRKQRGISIRSLTREASQRINRPLQRMAASLRLRRLGASVDAPKRALSSLSSDPTHCVLPKRTTDGSGLRNNARGQNPEEAHLLLQNDGEFGVRLTKDISVSVSSGDLLDTRKPGDLEGDGIFNERSGASAYLKEQFFSFFQPTGNKLAMKLFGTKMALDREKQRLEQQGRWIIHPCSNFRFYWDVVMLLLLIANLIILPVAISFFNEELSIQWIAFNCISDTVFLVDIAVNFRTGIIKNNFADEIMLNPKEIARQYIRTWFFLDLLSSLPLDYIYLILHDNEKFTQFVHAGRALRFLRFVKLLSLIRLLRLSRLVRYVSQWEEFLNLANKFIGIFNLVLLLLLLGHWNACLQFLIPMLNDYPVDSWVSKGKLQVSP
ncbi:unnamed protein product [Echinostoma caproni]|uniref:Potassium/sodium hyperpolarization-activated cyclic nucleotide-gated channel 2 n=1 Tax=Echinostoma caproni TaxID=27848 RepID=A0A183A5C8_9TREM|nr:unnamed protein product [Echinostoma caproni]